MRKISRQISWASVLALAFWTWGTAHAGVDVWTPIGPENAQLLHVATDPYPSTRLYATGETDVYRSDNSGASWTRITPLQPPIHGCDISPIAVQSDGAVYLSACSRLYKSTDYGISWTWRGLDDGAPIVDPSDRMVLYLYAVASYGSVDGTLYKTTDGGMDWLPINSNLRLNVVNQLLVDPTLPSRLYAISQDSVYRSLDGGVLWEPVNSGLPHTTLNSLALWGSTLFVGTGGFGIYKSVDSGATWTPANNGMSTQSVTNVRVGSGSTVYAATSEGATAPSFRSNFYRSTDGGAGWLLTGTLNTLVSDFAVSRLDDSILYAATLRGLAKSSDGGTTWTFDPHNGLKNASVGRLYVDAQNPSVLYAGSDFGDYRSVDRGAVWSLMALPDGMPIRPLGVSPSRSGTVYGTNPVADPGAIYRSTNFGADWAPILSGVHTSFSFLLEPPRAATPLFAIGTQNGAVLASFVQRSDDGGINWRDAAGGLPPSPTSAAAMDFGNPNVLYTAPGYYDVYRTTDGGGSWAKVSGSPLRSGVATLAADPVNSGRLFAAFYGLSRSDNGGATWGSENPALADVFVAALAIDPGNSSNVYAATGGRGLYRSVDGGATFRPINHGLSDADSLLVSAITVDPTDGRNLFIGTSAGVFALTLDQYDSFVPVIEFYNSYLDHYFMASELQADVAALDSNEFPGWTRTGQTFKAFPQPTGAAQPVCRFYIPPPHGDSHFYSANSSECTAVLKASTDPSDPAYPLYSGYEHETAAAFYVDVPAAGSCPPGEAPVYRLWNKRFDSNHRYTTDPAIRDAMIAKGYVLEGAVMCALL